MQKNEATLQRVQSVIQSSFQNVLGIDPRGQDLQKKNISAWDSLRHAELILSIQEELQIRFSASEILGCESSAQIEKVLMAKLLFASST